MVNIHSYVVLDTFIEDVCFNGWMDRRLIILLVSHISRVRFMQSKKNFKLRFKCIETDISPNGHISRQKLG